METAGLMMEIADRLSQLITEEGLDFLVLNKPGSVAYATGHTVAIETGPSVFSGGPTTAIIARTGDCAVICVNAEAANQCSWARTFAYEGVGHERPADFHQNFQAALRLALGELGVGGRLGIEGTGYPLGPLFQDSVCVEIEARLNRVRAIKCEAEKPLLRRAAETAAVGQNAFYKYLQPGRCELEVFNDIRREMEIFAGQRIAMAGDFVSGREQTSRVGGWPTARRIEAGDPVICDLSPRVGRYWGDSCASVVAGEAGSGFLKLFGAARSALTHAVSVMRPGLRISDLDAQLREIVRREGFHYPHHSGHSIGTSVPEWPRIVPHEDSVLAEGMFMMVEPGAYDPGIGGARCEWTIEIVKGGCRVVAPFEHRPSC
jgi:Xaa-Pro dipeptidase